ncbi:MAG: DUF805 domain-containing protein [Sphingomonas sp.]|jgi:uncharacterized membrane protein YhaH (DUF805 family)|uniref:DUF805 domain-containing protein n=1 Tax=Sphingomonas sp. TaxID=28214 RepID=UPI0035622CB6
MRAVLMPLTHCLQFHGRAARREFWPWILFLGAVFILLIEFQRPIDDLAVALLDGSPLRFGTLVVAFDIIALPLAFLVTAAITARRLHDTGARGIWVLLPWVLAMVSLFLYRTYRSGAGDILALAALLGMLAVVARCALPGTRGENRYGADPRDDGLGQLAATFE